MKEKEKQEGRLLERFTQQWKKHRWLLVALMFLLMSLLLTQVWQRTLDVPGMYGWN